MVLFTDFADYLTVDLPVNMPTALYYGTPQLKHLLFALDRYRKYLVILFSEEEARVIQVFLTAAAAEAQIPVGYEGGIALRPGGCVLPGLGKSSRVRTKFSKSTSVRQAPTPRRGLRS